MNFLRFKRRFSASAIERNAPLDGIAAIAPFLSEKTMDAVADALIKKRDIAALGSIAPFI